MSNEAHIKMGYKNAVQLLKKCGLFKSENKSRSMTFNKNKISKEFIAVCQKDNYKEIYDVALKKGDYDILLKDNSFFQFTYEKNKDEIFEIRYAYYDVPFVSESYENFLKLNDLEYVEVGESFLDEYEQYISESDLKNQVIPIRYDYDKIRYDMIIHSLSHMHLGHNNEVRIPCDRVLCPDTFVSFIIRQVYFKYYKSMIKDDEFKAIYLNKYKQSIKDIIILNEEEKDDIYLA